MLGERLKDFNTPVTIEGKTFTVCSVVSAKDVIPFPLKVVDLSTSKTIVMPEAHIGIRQQSSPKQVLDDMNETGVWNVIQFAQNDIEQRLKVASHLIQNPIAFLDSPGKHFFDFAGSKADKVKGEHRWAFRASSQKRYILNMISSYVFSLPGAKPIAESILLVADELFTNAIYNAPFSDKDFSLDRTTMVFLDPALSPEIMISHNAKYLFLGCLDRFGSFDCEDFLKKTTLYKKIQAQDFLDSDIGGSGIGMLRIVDLAPDLFIVVEKGKRSFVGCIFPLGMSPKKVRLSSRNFFLKSFETHGNEAGSIVVEKRGTKSLLRLVGNIDNNTSFKDLFAEEPTEVAFDMRLLESISGEPLAKFMTFLRSQKNMKRVSFEFVPMALTSQVSAFITPDSKVVEISSLWDSMECKGCKATQTVVLKPFLPVAPQVPRTDFNCPNCGAKL